MPSLSTSTTSTKRAAQWDCGGRPDRRRARAGRGRLPLRAFEGSKVGVIGLEREGASRPAARQRRRGWRGWGRDRLLRGYPLDLAEEPALPVADNRQRR